MKASYPVLFLALSLVAALPALCADKTFDGEIMDKQCAQMRSHDNMMKAQGATNAADCTQKCVKNGDSYALFDSTKGTVYPIEDGKKVEQFAGQRVHVTGSYEEGADVLKVKTVSAAK
jgi:hypothetical protein